MRSAGLAFSTAALSLASLLPAASPVAGLPAAALRSTPSIAVGVVPSSDDRLGLLESRSHATAARRSGLGYVTRVRTTKRVVFITIDDGVVRDREFLRLVRRTRLPVTVFLTLDYARPGPGLRYFRRLQTAGAVMENHTLSHPDLRGLGDSQLHREVCGAASREERLFGRAPTLFRAPYGSYDDRVLRTARSCGMTTVGWDAVMPPSGALETWNGHGRLYPGDIVLLHFAPGMVGQLRRVLAEAERRHLRVAPLQDYVRAPR